MQLQQLSHINWLVNSWQRSEQAGLTQQSRAQDIRLSDNKLKERRQELAGLHYRCSTNCLHTVTAV